MIQIWIVNQTKYDMKSENLYKYIRPAGKTERL